MTAQVGGSFGENQRFLDNDDLEPVVFLNRHNLSGKGWFENYYNEDDFTLSTFLILPLNDGSDSRLLWGLLRSSLSLDEHAVLNCALLAQ